jgi:tetratricopeptide (TPR) repeat protein
LRLLVAASAAVVLVLAVSPAAPLHAQSAPPNPGDGAASGGAPKDGKVVAREQFRRARKLHEAGRYDEAAAAYLEAYRHFPAPAFLYNAGQVFRLAGDADRALEHYRRYVELEPGGEGAADARQFIAELEAGIAERERSRKEADAREGDGAAGGAESGAGAGEAADAELGGAGEGAGEAGAGPVPGAETGEGSSGRSLVVAGTASAGAGVVALGVAVAFGARARARSDELSRHRGPWGPEQHELWESGQSAERTMTVGLVVGGVALATGGALYWLGRRKARQAGAERARQGAVIGVAPSSGGAVLFTAGRF